MSIKLVLFDLDGTLVNTLADLCYGVNRELEKYNFPTHKEEAFKYFAGNGIPKMVERALPSDVSADLKEKITADFLSYYADHYCDKSYAYKGTVELAKALKEKGLLIAVVTNKADEVASLVVNKLFGNIFDFIMGQKKGIPPKPDPTAALLTMEKLGVKPQECAFVGDTGVDVLTGANSGAYPVGVLWGFREKKELIENGAKSIIEDPAELIGIIDNLNGDEK